MSPPPLAPLLSLPPCLPPNARNNFQEAAGATAWAMPWLSQAQGAADAKPCKRMQKPCKAPSNVLYQGHDHHDPGIKPGRYRLLRLGPRPNHHRFQTPRRSLERKPSPPHNLNKELQPTLSPPTSQAASSAICKRRLVAPLVKSSNPPGTLVSVFICIYVIMAVFLHTYVCMQQNSLYSQVFCIMFYCTVRFGV